MTEKTVGVIGLGIMGGAITANLVKRGFAVRGYDIDTAAVGRLKKNGGAVDVTIYDNGHRNSRADALRRAAAFLKFHVPAPGCGCSLE